jgi:predicted anti-sigma-YlaC factor YlaD
MNCTEARDRLLEADLAEIQGEADTDLSLHLLGCAACRAVAERLSAEERSLAAALDAVRPRLGVEEALTRAEAESASRRGVLTLPLRKAWSLVPLAAAAAVAGILVTGNGGQLPGEPIDVAAVSETPVPTVVESTGQSVAVFETENPDIVVVWTF